MRQEGKKSLELGSSRLQQLAVIHQMKMEEKFQAILFVCYLIPLHHFLSLFSNVGNYLIGCNLPQVR
jgi:hypothetical protein